MTNKPPWHGHLTAAVGLSAAFVLASCSQTAPASSPTTATASPTQPLTTTSHPPSTSVLTSAPSTAVARHIEIHVTGKRVTPQPAMVNIAVGELLQVGVTSDHDNALHAHGFDIERALKAGRRLEITVKGTQPGVYDIELHEPELRLLQVAVR